MHGQRAGAGREAFVHGLGDREGVEFGHLAVVVAEEVHVTPTVEVRPDGDHVPGPTQGQRGELTVSSPARGVVVGDVEVRVAGAPVDGDRWLVAPRPHPEGPAASRVGDVDDDGAGVPTVGGDRLDVRHLLRERAAATLGDGQVWTAASRGAGTAVSALQARPTYTAVPVKGVCGVIGLVSLP